MRTASRGLGEATTSLTQRGSSGVTIPTRDTSDAELERRRKDRLRAMASQIKTSLRVLALPPASGALAASASDAGPAPAVEKRIFLVHGRDDAAKYSVKSFIEQHVVDHKVTILHEQPSQGRTVIEKFEQLGLFYRAAWTSQGVRVVRRRCRDAQ